MRVEEEKRRIDPAFLGFYVEEKYIGRFNKCSANYQEIMSDMLVEVQEQEEEPVPAVELLDRHGADSEHAGRQHFEYSGYRLESND